MKARMVRLPDLHWGQSEVARSKARFRVVAAGRRWRKSGLGALECVVVAQRGQHAWWVAPTFPIASIGWGMIRSLAIQFPGVQIAEGDRVASFPGGGWVQVKSASDPDSLRGQGLDLVVLDEAAFIRERAWVEALRPALADRQGRALFISTPKGRNWFYRLWIAGQDGRTDWQSWQFPTSANPCIAVSEIEAARQSMPERAFLQEFEAQFLDDAGAVFRRVGEATERVLPLAGAVVVGVDWGKIDDFTVLTAIDSGGQVLEQDAFNQIDYAVQRERLKAFCDRHHAARVMVETNSIGEPIREQLWRDGLPVEGFTTTAQSKVAIVEALALAFERNEIALPPDRALLNELQAFEMSRLPAGAVRYAAPQGIHDDRVMSLAFAWHAIRHRVVDGALMV